MSGDKCHYCDGTGELFGEVGATGATSFELSSCPYCTMGIYRPLYGEVEKPKKKTIDLAVETILKWEGSRGKR